MNGIDLGQFLLRLPTTRSRSRTHTTTFGMIDVCFGVCALVFPAPFAGALVNGQLIVITFYFWTFGDLASWSAANLLFIVQAEKGARQQFSLPIGTQQRACIANTDFHVWYFRAQSSYHSKRNAFNRLNLISLYQIEERKRQREFARVRAIEFQSIEFAAFSLHAYSARSVLNVLCKVADAGLLCTLSHYLNSI